MTFGGQQSEEFLRCFQNSRDAQDVLLANGIFKSNLTVESPALPALIHNVFYHHGAGRPHWS